jgi:hypothetical protein
MQGVAEAVHTFISEFCALTLNAAALSGNATIAKLLIETGAAINKRDGAGWSPLEVAADRGHCDVLKLLLEAGAAVDVQNRRGLTALHYAAKRHISAVIALIDCGANLDVQDEDGNTAMHLAISHRNSAIVTCLLLSGTALGIRNRCGRTPLDNAVVYRLERAVTRLQSPALCRQNVLVRSARFCSLGVEHGFAPDDAVSNLEAVVAQHTGLSESVLSRVLGAVSSRAAIAETRLVCKAWRRRCDRTLSAMPVDVFDPAKIN